MKNFILLFSIIALISCNKETTEIDYEKPLKVETENRSVDFSSFESELLDFWTQGLEDYSLETFCSCECDGVYAAKDILDKHHDLLPSIAHSYEPFDQTCTELKEWMSKDCIYTERSEYLSYIDSQVQPSKFFSNSEKILLKQLLTDIDNGSFKANSYRESWYQLPSNSSSGNSFSAFIIEIANSGYIFVDSFDFDNEDDEIQALWNKVAGALIGGTGAYLLSGFEHAHCCNDEEFTGGMAWSAFWKGAVMGAGRSL